MTFTTAFIAAALVVPPMSPPEYDDCEVVTNCVFDTSRGDAKMFALKIELDATSSNGVEVVFGHAALNWQLLPDGRSGDDSLLSDYFHKDFVVFQSRIDGLFVL